MNINNNNKKLNISANDDAIRSIKLILGKLADAIDEGSHRSVNANDDYETSDESFIENNIEKIEESTSVSSSLEGENIEEKENQA